MKFIEGNVRCSRTSTSAQIQDQVTLDRRLYNYVGYIITIIQNLLYSLKIYYIVFQTKASSQKYLHEFTIVHFLVRLTGV